MARLKTISFALMAATLLLIPLLPQAQRTSVGIEITGNRPEDVEAVKIEDPFEGANRNVFGFNEGVDEMFLEPVSRGYVAVVPEWGRNRVGNFLSNLDEPVTFVSSVLQGDVDNAFTSFWRFVINSTIGIGGLFDQAQYAGLEKREEDFGQTLAVGGADSGSYVVLPLLGPSSVRDTVGLVVDSFINPFNYVSGGLIAARAITDAVNSRSNALELTDEIERTSFDPYATFKSAYTQQRADAVRNGVTPTGQEPN